MTRCFTACLSGHPVAAFVCICSAHTTTYRYHEAHHGSCLVSLVLQHAGHWFSSCPGWTEGKQALHKLCLTFQLQPTDRLNVIPTVVSEVCTPSFACLVTLTQCPGDVITTMIMLHFDRRSCFRQAVASQGRRLHRRREHHNS